MYRIQCSNALNCFIDLLFRIDHIISLIGLSDDKRTVTTCCDEGRKYLSDVQTELEDTSEDRSVDRQLFPGRENTKSKIEKDKLIG
jgi:hypothetical protein